MGTIVLLLGLLILLFIIFKKNDKDILSPSLFTVCMYIMSTLAVLLNFNNWDINISTITIVIILSSIIMFFLGELIGTALYKFRNKKKLEQSSYNKDANLNLISKIKNKMSNLINPHRFVDIDSIQVPLHIVLIVCSFMLIITVYYLYCIWNLSIKAGNTEGISKMIYYARVAYNSVDIDSDMGIIINQGVLLSRCIAYYFAYAIVFNVVKKNFNRYNLLYFIPIIIYFFDLILSTQRANMIAFVSFVLIIYMIIIRKEEVNTKKSNFRILKFGAVGAVILVVVFTFLGLFTGKTQSLGIINSLLIYTGSSILALNQWLLDPTTSAFFGESTLRLFYAGIGKFGFDVPIYNEYFFEHVQIGENVRTNIFTPLRRYIQDYSYTGLFFIQFITGLIYGFFLKVLVNSKYAGLGLILYANFFYPIFSASIEERIMTNYLSLTTIYTVFYFVIIVIVFNKFIKLKNKEDSIQK